MTIPSITLSQLESHLWEAANISRQSWVAVFRSLWPRSPSACILSRYCGSVLSFCEEFRLLRLEACGVTERIFPKDAKCIAGLLNGQPEADANLPPEEHVKIHGDQSDRNERKAAIAGVVGKPIVVTPDDPGGFVEAVKATSTG